MASVKRKMVTRPLPESATLQTRTRKATAKELRRNPSQTRVTEQIATWSDRWGKKRSAVVVTSAVDGALRIRVQSATYTAVFRDADGIVQEVSTGCRDVESARSKLAELTRTVERIKSGALSRNDAEVGKFKDIPLSQHITDYIDELRARKVNADRIKTSETYLTGDATACGFKYLRDLSADSLRRYLRSQAEMSAATYNWHAGLWVAFGWWLTGRRIEGKRQSQTGERRLLSNPFEGFGKVDESADRRRVARPLTIDEMRRLLDVARSRPLNDALTVRRGKNKGKLLAKLSDERREELELLGRERAMIYKTAILTGLRLNELRTLHVGDLSFGDVPFLVLRVSNEKSRKGSTVPLRSDLAAELQEWTAGNESDAVVFNVPSGLLRILNRDLVAAEIPKVDEQGRRVHIHALRHSTGTHLSAANVSPRTAQAVMRHSDISLTMNVYTDERLLDAAGAVELLPDLGSATGERESPRTVASDVASGSDNLGQDESNLGNMLKPWRLFDDEENPAKRSVLRDFLESGRQDSIRTFLLRAFGPANI
ncbi:tyrosine-type recombinase/integrase [Planctomycetaceae bacterium SH139]